MFPGRVISLRGDIGWPARSPDLAPCDFFLWGHLRNEVFKKRPATVAELKAAIVLAVENVPPDMVERAMKNFRERLMSCVNFGGDHLKNIVFKK